MTEGNGLMTKPGKKNNLLVGASWGLDEGERWQMRQWRQFRQRRKPNRGCWRFGCSRRIDRSDGSHGRRIGPNRRWELESRSGWWWGWFGAKRQRLSRLRNQGINWVSCHIKHAKHEPHWLGWPCGCLALIWGLLIAGGCDLCVATA